MVLSYACSLWLVYKLVGLLCMSQLSHDTCDHCCRWLREGREVKEEELSQPYKVAKRRGVKETPNAPQEDAETVQEEPVVPVSDAMVTKMYGLWQTQAWVAPTAVGGVVPKNDRGNVHCPPFASELPKVTGLRYAQTLRAV